MAASSKTKEDRKRFTEVVNQPISEKTNVIWYPEKNREPNGMTRYIEDV